MQMLYGAVMVSGHPTVEPFFVIPTEVTELFIYTHTYLSRNTRTQTHAHANTLSHTLISCVVGVAGVGQHV
jgi:hypothetical protein